MGANENAMGIKGRLLREPVVPKYSSHEVDRCAHRTRVWTCLVSTHRASGCAQVASVALPLKLKTSETLAVSLPPPDGRPEPNLACRLPKLDVAWA